MSVKEVANVLARFKKAGGETFAEEPVSTLLTKFAVYKLYEKDWPQLYKRIYTRQRPELLQEQIAVLRAADRRSLVSVPHEVCWALLNSISMPDTIQPNTFELTVNRRMVGCIVKEYAEHRALIEDIHPGFKRLPSDGLLVVMGDTSTVDQLLISAPGRNIFTASTTTIQDEVLPKVEKYAREKRSAKLIDMCGVLSYSTIRVDHRLAVAMESVGLIESEKDINEIVPKKVHLRSKLEQHADEHRELCANVDRDKLTTAGHSIETVAFELPDIGSLSKADIKHHIAAIAEVKPVLQLHKKNLRGQQKSLSAEIKALQEQRESLMRTLDSRSYYRSTTDHSALHVSSSMRNKTYHELQDYKQLLASYVGQLAQHQYDPLKKVDRAVIKGWY